MGFLIFCGAFLNKKAGPPPEDKNKKAVTVMNVIACSAVASA